MRANITYVELPSLEKTSEAPSCGIVLSPDKCSASIVGVNTLTGCTLSASTSTVSASLKVVLTNDAVYILGFEGENVRMVQVVADGKSVFNLDVETLKAALKEGSIRVELPPKAKEVTFYVLAVTGKSVVLWPLGKKSVSWSGIIYTGYQKIVVKDKQVVETGPIDPSEIGVRKIVITDWGDIEAFHMYLYSKGGRYEKWYKVEAIDQIEIPFDEGVEINDIVIKGDGVYEVKPSPDGRVFLIPRGGQVITDFPTSVEVGMDVVKESGEEASVPPLSFESEGYGVFSADPNKVGLGDVVLIEAKLKEQASDGKTYVRAIVPRPSNLMPENVVGVWRYLPVKATFVYPNSDGDVQSEEHDFISYEKTFDRLTDLLSGEGDSPGEAIAVVEASYQGKTYGVWATGGTRSFSIIANDITPTFKVCKDAACQSALTSSEACTVLANRVEAEVSAVPPATGSYYIVIDMGPSVNLSNTWAVYLVVKDGKHLISVVKDGDDLKWEDGSTIVKKPMSINESKVSLLFGVVNGALVVPLAVRTFVQAGTDNAPAVVVFRYAPNVFFTAGQPNADSEGPVAVIGSIPAFTTVLKDVTTIEASGEKTGLSLGDGFEGGVVEVLAPLPIAHPLKRFLVAYKDSLGHFKFEAIDLTATPTVSANNTISVSWDVDDNLARQIKLLVRAVARTSIEFGKEVALAFTREVTLKDLKDGIDVYSLAIEVLKLTGSTDTVYVQLLPTVFVEHPMGVVSIELSVDAKTLTTSVNVPTMKDTGTSIQVSPYTWPANGYDVAVRVSAPAFPVWADGQPTLVEDAYHVKSDAEIKYATIVNTVLSDLPPGYIASVVLASLVVKTPDGTEVVLDVEAINPVKTLVQLTLVGSNCVTALVQDSSVGGNFAAWDGSFDDPITPEGSKYCAASGLLIYGFRDSTTNKAVVTAYSFTTTTTVAVPYGELTVTTTGATITIHNMSDATLYLVKPDGSVEKVGEGKETYTVDSPGIYIVKGKAYGDKDVALVFDVQGIKVWTTEDGNIAIRVRCVEDAGGFNLTVAHGSAVQKVVGELIGTLQTDQIAGTYCEKEYADDYVRIEGSVCMRYVLIEKMRSDKASTVYLTAGAGALGIAGVLSLLL